MKIITINLIGTYFHQIKAGTKTFEYRLRTPFWRKRLEGRAYDMIRICWGYPKVTLIESSCGLGAAMRNRPFSMSTSASSL